MTSQQKAYLCDTLDLCCLDVRCRCKFSSDSDDASSDYSDSDAEASRPKKRAITCSACGDAGHTSRSTTCPAKTD